MDPTVGVTLGKYQLVASIGRGGMADVFLALARGDMGFTKLVVLKCMRVTDQEQAFTSMFFDEVRLAARLNHPNIVATFDGGDAGGTYFLAMEFLEGQPLDQVWRAWSGPYQPHARVWALMMAEVLAGLGYAHTLKDFDGSPLKVVHRDVSPQNIFLTYDGAVKLMDFGIAKAASNLNHTEAGVLKGKIRYMSPEQFGGRPVDHRSDLFSAGVVLWELIAGRRLLTGEVAAVMHRLLSAEPLQRLAEVVPEVPARLDALVARALEKDPAHRFQSASEMRAELLAYVRESGPLEPSELGRALLQTFSEHREQVRAQVEAHVAQASRAHSVHELGNVRLGAGLDTPSGTMRPIARHPLGTEATQMAAGRAAIAAALAPTHPAAPAAAPVPTGTGAHRTPTPVPALPPPAPRWRVPAAIVGALAVLGAAGAVLLRPAPAPAEAQPQAPAPVAAAPPPVPAAPPAGNAEQPPPVAPSGGSTAAPQGTASAPAGTAAAPPGASARPAPTEAAPAEPAPAPAVVVDRSPAARPQPPARKPAPAEKPAAAAATPRGAGGSRTMTDPAGAGSGSGSGGAEPAPTVVAAATPSPPPAAQQQHPAVEPAPAPATDPAPARQPPAPVSAPAPAPAPGISAATLRQVVAANREGIQDCYDHAILDGRAIVGKVTLTIDVAPSGAVTQVGKSSTILERGAKLEQCVVEAVKLWKFPPPGDGAPARVEKTFTFGN